MTAKHREVEERFRDLLASNDLQPPDRVLYEPASVGFVWEEPKVVVFVDFELEDELEPPLEGVGDA